MVASPPPYNRVKLQQADRGKFIFPVFGPLTSDHLGLTLCIMIIVIAIVISKASNRSFKNKAGYYLIEAQGHTVTGTKDRAKCNTNGKLVTKKGLYFTDSFNGKCDILCYEKLDHRIMQLHSFDWLSGNGISVIIENWIIASPGI